jgi:outer membrane protein
MRLVMSVVFLVALAAPAAAQTKIGYINLQETLVETKAGKAAKRKLESEKEEKQKQVNDKREKLKADAEALEKQRGVLKAEALAKKERELQEDYAALQQLFMQLQQDLAKQEAQLTREIFNQASSIIQDIAKRESYHMIVEKNEGAVLWADPTLDITKEVNRRLDAGEGGKAAAAPAKAPAAAPKAPAAAPKPDDKGKK